MFVCGGENIYPGEVETLLERHPDIIQACVVPVPDEIKHEKPFAFVVPRAGSRVTEDEVKRTRWLTPRPFSIRATSSSCRSCRWRARARSTGSRCGGRALEHRQIEAKA